MTKRECDGCGNVGHELMTTAEAQRDLFRGACVCVVRALKRYRTRTGWRLLGL